jgi:hypothetical protein
MPLRLTVNGVGNEAKIRIGGCNKAMGRREQGTSPYMCAAFRRKGKGNLWWTYFEEDACETGVEEAITLGGPDEFGQPMLYFYKQRV